MKKTDQLTAQDFQALVGATFQLGGGGLPSTSAASKWRRRSPVALDITYLPHMPQFSPRRVYGGGSEGSVFGGIFFRDLPGRDPLRRLLIRRLDEGQQVILPDAPDAAVIQLHSAQL